MSRMSGFSPGPVLSHLVSLGWAFAHSTYRSVSLRTSRYRPAV